MMFTVKTQAGTIVEYRKAITSLDQYLIQMKKAGITLISITQYT